MSCVLSVSSLLSRVVAVAVLLDRFCYIMMLCIPAATSHSMHNMEMFTKDVFYICHALSIHTPGCIYILL